MQHFTEACLCCCCRFIKGREIRCAVVKSEKTGDIQALSCMEYNVLQDDIRTTQDKYLCDEKGLPICEYHIFYFFIRKQVKINHKSCSSKFIFALVKFINCPIKLYSVNRYHPSHVEHGKPLTNQLVKGISYVN